MVFSSFKSHPYICGNFYLGNTFIHVG